RVHEDVAGAVAVDGEVVVVVHRPPVAGGQRAEHDGGGAHVVAERRQLVTGVDLRQQAAAPGPAFPEPDAVYDSTPTSSSRWLWYSTSITQNRPVPSLVVFGSDTERSTCRVRSRSPIRTGSWKVMVFSLMIASGRASCSLRSKWTCSGTAG